MSTKQHGTETQQMLEKHARLAQALDARFHVFGIPFGWDSILGLVPGIGDAITVIPAVWMMHDGYRAGIRRRALGRMVWNTGLDVTFGSIPVLGDVFDAAFKSHGKNAAVLRHELERVAALRPEAPRPTASKSSDRDYPVSSNA